MTELTTPFARFAEDRRGTVSIIFAMTFVVGVAFVGMAIDYGRALDAKTRLQNAVDVGALAGASVPVSDTDNRAAAVQKIFGHNLAGTPLSSVQPIISTGTSGVTVSAAYEYPTLIMGLMRVNSLTIVARALASSKASNGASACMVALSPTSSDALHIQGVNQLQADGCWAWVNSSSSLSMNGIGTSMATSAGFCTAGGISGADHFSPAPLSGCDTMADPFAGLALPAPEACTATNLNLSNGNFTLNPGTYCGGMVLRPRANVTFNPGLYIIKDGPLRVQGQAIAMGDGVVFVFTGPGAILQVLGGGSVNFRAPAADAAGVGDLQGFVFVQDKATTTAGATTTIQGGGSVTIEGLVYMPTYRVDIAGNGDINQNSRYFAMVADNFYLRGNGKLTLKVDAAAANLPDRMPKIKSGPILLD